MHHYSPSPRWLAVPGIGFPQNISVGPNVLDPEHFGIGRSQHVARGTVNMMLRLNRLTVSPRAHQRGHGFRPDGELVATTHRKIVMSYR
jgi:hypothetical protein